MSTATELRQLDQLPGSCSGCGACCLHVGHPMYFKGSASSPAETAWRDLPQDLKREHNEYLQAITDDYGQPCYWLDLATRTCKQYEHRPQVCRDLETGSADCLRLRQVQGIDR